jgi:hypothetical protein
MSVNEEVQGIMDALTATQYEETAKTIVDFDELSYLIKQHHVSEALALLEKQRGKAIKSIERQYSVALRYYENYEEMQ